MDDVIGSLDDLTPERLTRVLQLERGDGVAAVRVTLSKELPYSTVARLEVEYDRPIPCLPAQYFLKIVRLDATDLATSSEVEFYRRIAPGIGSPPVVRCFGAATSEPRGRSTLLLADLSDTHTQPTQRTAPSVGDTFRAMKALARCHAPYWNVAGAKTKIDPLFNERGVSAFIEKLEKSVSEFLSVVTDLSSTQRSHYRTLLKNADRIWGRLAEPQNLTVTHSDCHWWNFMWPRNASTNGDVYVIDWQLWHADLGARDLAFLLALGGFAEPRPEMENEFLAAYWEALAAGGVTGYSFDDLVVDYRWSAARNLNIPVIFRSQGKHVSTWREALRRAAGSYERLRCDELLA